METVFREYLPEYKYNNMKLHVSNDIVSIEDRDVTFCIDTHNTWVRGEDVLDIASLMLNPEDKHSVGPIKLTKNIFDDVFFLLTFDGVQTILTFLRYLDKAHKDLRETDKVFIKNEDVPAVASNLIKYARHALKNNMIGHQLSYMSILARNAVIKGTAVKLNITYLKDADDRVYCYGFREFKLEYIDVEGKAIYSYDQIIYPPVFKEEFDTMIKNLTFGNKIPYSMDKWDFEETRSNFNARHEAMMEEIKKKPTEAHCGELPEGK